MCPSARPSPRRPRTTWTRCSALLALGLAVVLCMAVGSVASAQLESSDEAQPDEPIEPDVFDPFEGIEPSGRIPAIDRPADLKHPERWRYIPEGRIKPGNIFQRLLTSSFIAPFIFRDGDVGTGFGLAVTDIDFRKQRRREFVGIFGSYTTEGQRSVGFTWRRWMHHINLPDGGVLQAERSFVRTSARYSKTLTRRFFGLGPSTTDGDETSYSDEVYEFSLGLERSVPDPEDDWIAGLYFQGEFHDLSSGKKNSKPSSRELFPRLYRKAEDRNLGWISGVWRYDTRDSQRNPYEGWEVGARVDGALVQRGGEIGARYRLWGTQVFSVPGLYHDGGIGENEEHPPTDTIAYGVAIESSSGDLPFYALPTLGGTNTLRGYIDGRWRDDASWTASLEYRFWVIPRGIPIWKSIRVERVGLALFADVGAVGPNPAELVRSRVRASYGVSLRISLERAAPFRVDFGFSDEGLNVSARFGLAF